MPDISTSTPLVAALFALTYLGLALGRVPGLRIDRAGIALVGAAAMLVARAMTFDEAVQAIDFRTIVLLLGMMIVVAYLRLAGFFTVATDWIARRGSNPWTLLALVIALSGLSSAFLVNDVVCVALTPLVLDLCRRLKRPPVPYLIALATSSNIGSVATITGNPQNMIIGSLSAIPYVRFAERLAPIAVIGLVVDFAIIALVYRKSLARQHEARHIALRHHRLHPALLGKSLLVTLVTIGLFFAGLPISIVALAAAGVLLLDRVRPEKVYRWIDWPLLVMFAGLFVVVRAFEVHVVRGWHLEQHQELLQSPVVLLSLVSVVLSNLVSNVPAVLLFEPLIQAMTDPELAWLSLAMSSTLAGNLTLLGSVANLIVVENARRAGIEVSFLEYLKVGLPLTLLTTAIGIAWMQFVHY